MVWVKLLFLILIIFKLSACMVFHHSLLKFFEVFYSLYSSIKYDLLFIFLIFLFEFLSTFIALDYYSCCWLLVMFIYWWWLFLLMIQRHLGAHLYTNVKQWNLHVFSSGCLSPYNAFSITSLRGRRLYLWYKFQKPKVSF